MLARAAEDGGAAGGVLFFVVIGIVPWFAAERRRRCPRGGHQPAVKHIKDGRCPLCRSAEF